MRNLKELMHAAALRYPPAMIEGEKDLPVQTGALPWRLAGKDKVEILLVTGRKSGRWTIPKGWPMTGKSLAEAAAQEAFEEAGVRGTVDPKPVGSFRHVKQLVALGDVEVSILVHRMWVDRELSAWPELGQRKRKWFKVKDAAERVDSDELRALILQTANPSRDAATRQ